MSDFRFGFTTWFDNSQVIKSLGADYQEVNLGKLADLTDDEIDAIAARSREIGLPVEAANCMIPGEYKFTVDNPDYDAIDEYLERAFSKAKRLGIGIVVMGSSGARNFPEGVTYETAFERLVYFLKNHAAPVCEKYGIVCALENLSYGESNILNTIDEELRVIEAVGSEQIKILVDFYHFGYNKDSFDSIRMAKEHIAHVHVASVVNGRQYPAPDDGEDYGVITDLLREIGYTQRISFEAHMVDGQNFPDCAKGSLEVFRKL